MEVFVFLAVTGLILFLDENFLDKNIYIKI